MDLGRRRRHAIMQECYAAEGLSEHDVTRLASYNGRVSEGVLHTPEYQERMRDLQGRFDRARLAICKREGFKVVDLSGLELTDTEFLLG